jgi:hypothetical protein
MYILFNRRRFNARPQSGHTKLRNNTHAGMRAISATVTMRAMDSSDMRILQCLRLEAKADLLDYGVSTPSFVSPKQRREPSQDTAPFFEIVGTVPTSIYASSGEEMCHPHTKKVSHQCRLEERRDFFWLQTNANKRCKSCIEKAVEAQSTRCHESAGCPSGYSIGQVIARDVR